MRRFTGFALASALALAGIAVSTAAQAQVGIGVSVYVAPPLLPVYEQPEIPGPGYLWAPGYWAWSDEGYYWVPGTWVLAPQPGFLWTPGYWGWAGGAYLWHTGYWGPHVGFYGGVNYGYGYTGLGYAGGYWEGGRFRYNSAVNNIQGARISNVYNQAVVNNVTVTRVSYNGGGGIQATANAEQLAAEHEQHLAPAPSQLQHEQAAHNNPELRATANHGMPPILATARPAQFTGPGIVAGHPLARQSEPLTAPGHAGSEYMVPNHAASMPNHAATMPSHGTAVPNHSSAVTNHGASVPPHNVSAYNPPHNAPAYTPPPHSITHNAPVQTHAVPTHNSPPARESHMSMHERR
jgi:hypothetical protein